jgi:AGCS family alanine or glycine:cation symporter
MAHGAAKTKEPIREGLVAMLGPFIDTIVVCTLTALAILITGTWLDSEVDGVTVTVNAFDAAIPSAGVYILMLCVLIFATTSLFSYSFYGTKCLSFLVGAKYKDIYNLVYVLGIVFGAVASLNTIINIIDAAYALMSIPTMLSAIYLAPKVKKEARIYFRKLKENKRFTREGV